MLTGLRLGPYTIRSLIGAGAMGEVYRAHDERLGRDIAIKILPDAVTNDANRLARFEREARILASLNHPNIAAIYGIEEAGAGPGDAHRVRGLVLELVEGETLAERIARTRPGPAISLDEALNIARQIADALDAAHEKGIVHRDLKPANVKLTPDGVVKVLDFGLAKSTPLEDPGPDTSTVSAVGTTRDGQMLGTVPYMSPEQARGRAVDKRTDIWAFGCVLFEMLTGQRAFHGETIPDTLAAIVEREPRWSTLPPGTPVSVRRLLRRCLEKDARRRLRDIGDARIDLERPASQEPASVGDGETRAHPGSRWRLIAAASAIGLIGAIGWLWSSLPFGSRDIIWRPRPIATSSSSEWDSRISPDGQWISFVSSTGGATQVLVKRIASGEVKPVALPAGSVLSQLWSPDGDQLAYVLRQGDASYLQVVPAFFGGLPAQSVALQPAPYDVRLLRWIGQTIYAQYFARSGRSLVQLDLVRGTTTNLSDGWKVDGRITGYDVSPDGRKVVFAMSTKSQEDVWVANLDGTSAKRLASDPSFERDPLWSRRGEAVIVQSNRGGQVDLWEIDVDSGRFERLTASETAEDPESTSADGTLVSFRQESENSNLWASDRAANAITQLTDDALSDFAPTATATGGTVVFQRTRPTPLVGNRLQDSTLLLGVIERLKFQSDPQVVADGYAPLLSPDGSRVAYLQRGADPTHAKLLVRQLRTGETMTLSSACPQPAYFPTLRAWAEQNLAWNPSGTDLYFVELADVYTVRRYRVGADAADAPLAAAESNQRIHDLHPSADGRTLAYLTSSSGGSRVHLLDLESGRDRWAVPLEGAAVSSRGWLAGSTGLVLARASRFNGDFSATVEVLVASMTGMLRSAGVVDNAFIATTRLAPARAVLYLARIENGVHNLHEFSLTTGRVRRVTDNALPGVTFSGVEPLGDGGLVAVRHERRSDIWLVEATSSSLDSPGRYSR